MTTPTQRRDYLDALFGQRGRTAVVTGPSSGLGATMAQALATAGGDVIAVARRKDRLLALNLTAQWRLAKALFEWLAKSAAGRIIEISSIHGISAPVRAGLRASAVSKHGLVGLTRTQAVEWAEHGITANAIAPGYFPTEMTEQLLASRAARRSQQFVPMDRFGTPEELAPALLFFASPGRS